MALLWASILVLIIAVLETVLVYSVSAKYLALRQRELELENKEEN